MLKPSGTVKVGLRLDIQNRADCPFIRIPGLPQKRHLREMRVGPENILHPGERHRVIENKVVLKPEHPARLCLKRNVDTDRNSRTIATTTNTDQAVAPT